MSEQLQWQIIKKQSCFLMRKNAQNGQVFTKEPNNLKNINSYKFNGLVRKKTVGVEEGPDGKGVVLITKRNKKRRNPVSTYQRTVLKKDKIICFKLVNKATNGAKYRPDLRNAAIRRASAIWFSQKQKKSQK